jgi:hypothetical protein
LKCVRLRCQASLCNHLDDVADSEFSGYNHPTGVSDDEGGGEGGPYNPDSDPLSPPMRAETTSETAVAVVEVAAVEEPKPKGQGTPKARRENRDPCEGSARVPRIDLCCGRRCRLSPLIYSLLLL